MSKGEYLVTSVYNKTISDETAVSKLRASIGFPDAVKSVKGGTFSGKTAEFDKALLDLLVLETPPGFGIGRDFSLFLENFHLLLLSCCYPYVIISNVFNGFLMKQHCLTVLIR